MACFSVVKTGTGLEIGKALSDLWKRHVMKAVIVAATKIIGEHENQIDLLQLFSF